MQETIRTEIATLGEFGLIKTSDKRYRVKESGNPIWRGR